MDRDRARVLLLFTIYVVLIVATLFIQDWFVASTPAGTMSIDLRQARMCVSDGGCMSFSLGQLKSGMYGTLGFSTFYGAIVLSLLVAYQAITRVTAGFANTSLSKLGYFAAIGLFGTAGSAAYLFNPQVTGIEAEMMGIDVERTLAPLLFFAAMGLALAVFYYASSQASEDVGEYKPLAPAPSLAPATALPPRAKAPTAPPPAREKLPSQPIVPVSKHPSSPPSGVVTKHSSSPPSSAFGSGPISVIPEHLRKKLKYVVLTAQLTRGGIDARREDGSSKLVMWRDVVGLVARRMPGEHDGVTFLDIVSTAGSTLRILPWTRVTGETFEGEGDVFMRALLAKLVGFCASASLDPATQRFHKGEPAAQLPDLTKLAAHDDKLA